MMTMQSRPQSGPSAANLRALLQSGPCEDAVALLFPMAAPIRLSIERVHFPGQKPVQFQIRASGADGQSQMLLAEWAGEAVVSAAEAGSARLAKVQRGQASSSVSVVADRRHGLVLRKPGFDAKLPGLRLLHDPAWAAERLSMLGLDPASEITLVAHRIGKRAVLRISGAQGTTYARLRPVTSLSGRDAFDRHKDLWAALGGAGDLTIPRPIGYDAEIGLAHYTTLSGDPPVFQGHTGFSASASVMRALSCLQALKIAAPIHTPEDELRILDTWAQRLAVVFPDLAQQMRAKLELVRGRMISMGPATPVLCHRDLHEGQILMHNGVTGLLDFDTLRLGDPAMDVGNLQAHLILASLRDGVTRSACITAMSNAVPQVPPPRITLWRSAALLRIAMIYAFSSEPRDVVHALIEEAH